MKMGRHGRQRTSPAGHRGIPVSLLCAKLGEDFGLFSDRTDEAVELETLLKELVSIHDAETADDDFR